MQVKAGTIFDNILVCDDPEYAKAQAENKPIFLSIGYSACHWCHVMEHESFENAEIAAFLNEHFVSESELRPSTLSNNDLCGRSGSTTGGSHAGSASPRTRPVTHSRPSPTPLSSPAR